MSCIMSNDFTFQGAPSCPRRVFEQWLSSLQVIYSTEPRLQGPGLPAPPWDPCLRFRITSDRMPAVGHSNIRSPSKPHACERATGVRSPSSRNLADGSALARRPWFGCGLLNRAVLRSIGIVHLWRFFFDLFIRRRFSGRTPLSFGGRLGFRSLGRVGSHAFGFPTSLRNGSSFRLILGGLFATLLRHGGSFVFVGLVVGL